MIIVEEITIQVLDKARSILDNDGVIVLPTDTNYNLVCNASSKVAIDRIFKIKQRSRHDLLSLFFSKPESWRVYGFSENNSAVERLIECFWPGPLNIIVKKKETVPSIILNGGETVALGCVSNFVWQSVVSYYNKPVALTSANRSGEVKEKLVTKEIALMHVGPHVDLFFSDNVPRLTTKSSTIIDFTEKNFKMVRFGDISISDLEGVVGEK